MDHKVTFTLAEFFTFFMNKDFIRKYLSSPSNFQQVPSEVWTLRKADFLRKACEQGLLSEGEANYLATRPILLTILSPDLCTMTNKQIEKQIRLSELVKKELYGTPKTPTESS